jgi:predicted nuclease with TOPRIM domain
MDMRIAEPIWHTDESGTEASLVERLEAQVEELTRKVGRLERRQHRFADMVRLLLELHDRTAARLHALDGRETHESVEELTQVAQELTQSMPGTMPLPTKPRRSPTHRQDA